MAEKTSRKSGGNPPISRHPLFPAIVALWFGALFGLASVAISPALIEQAVLATGIDSLVPMAAPPLGATARILFALVMTASGGVIGALLARRIARPETAARLRRRGATAAAETAAPTLPAANAAEEEAPAQPLRKVRAMRERARETAILDISDFEIGSFDEADEAREEPATAPEPANEPARAEAQGAAAGSLFDAYSHEITARRDNGPENHDRPDEGRETPQAPFAPLALASDDEEIAPEYDPVEDENDFTAGTTPAIEAADALSPEWAEADGGAAERIVSAELDSLSQVELLERLALAMARCRSEAAYPAAIRAAESPTPAEPEPEAGHGIAPEAEAEPRDRAQPAFEAPLVRLPRLSAVPDFDAPAPPEAAEPEPEAAEAATYQPVEPVTEPPRMPAALRPVGHDSGEDADEDALPGYIPPRHIGLAPAAPTGDCDEPAYSLDDGADEYEDEENDVLEEGYSSLLNISRSAGPRPPLSPADEWGADEWGADEAGAHIEPSLPGEETHGTDRPESSAEGRRPFDAPDGQDAGETEKALRAALATLQRMSGAA